MRSLSDKCREIYNEVVNQDRLDLTLRLTLLMLILRPGKTWYLILPISALAICAFIHRAFIHSRAFWLIVTLTLFLINNVYNWGVSDNHKFLISFWCLAIACSLSVKEADWALALNGSVLIGLVFLLATLWKVSSPVYMDRTAFHYYLLNDNRFYALAYLLGGMDPDVMRYNQHSMAKMGALAKTIPLESTAAIVWLAQVLTWWTLIIEGLLGILFLLPRTKITKWRDAILIVFIFTTYPPTSVTEFGLVLTTMGFAQCPAENKATRFCYLLLFVYVFLFTDGLMHQVFYDWLNLPFVGAN